MPARTCGARRWARWSEAGWCALSGGDHEHVADIVPDGFLEELEETLEVLADSEAVRALVEARGAPSGKFSPAVCGSVLFRS